MPGMMGHPGSAVPSMYGAPPPPAGMSGPPGPQPGMAAAGQVSTQQAQEHED